MIAGIFPVAIQQTAVVSNETQGSLITRDAIRKIQNAADIPGANTLFPVTQSGANVQVFAITTIAPAPGSPILGLTTATTGLLPTLGADSLYSADKRFGWVGFYRRDSSSAAGGTTPAGPYANIYVVALQNPNFPNYLYPLPASGQTTISASVPPPVPPSTYGYSPPQTAQIQAQFFYNSDGTTTIILAFNQSTTPPQQPNGITGAYVLVGTSVAAPSGANLCGRFFRLGNTTPLPSGFNAVGTNIYQAFVAQSGWDITPSDGYAAVTGTPPTPSFTANIFCIGAAPAYDSTNSYYDGPFTGQNQDIGVASAFIRVNTANN